MKSFFPVIALIAVVFLISGCSLGGTISDKISGISIPGIEKSSEATAAGTLSANIVYPRVGAEVSKTSGFSPVIRLHNEGGYEAEGQACITGGLDPAVFSKQGFSGCECQSFRLIKNDAGQFDDEDLKFGSFSIKAKEDARAGRELSTATRFEYGNDISAKICIPADLYSVQECGVQIKATGGPLQVDSIDETISPGEDADEASVEMTFRIHISNTGGGRLITESDYESPCRPLSFEELPVVYARIKNFPTDDDVKCGDIEFSGSSATVICRGIVNLVGPGGVAVFSKGQTPEVQFQLRYLYELRQSSQFRLV